MRDGYRSAKPYPFCPDCGAERPDGSTFYPCGTKSGDPPERSRECYERELTSKEAALSSLQLRLDIVTAAYQRFCHLDKLLCEADSQDEPFRHTARALWEAVKAASEEKDGGA